MDIINSILNTVDYSIYSYIFDEVDIMDSALAVEVPCRVGDTVYYVDSCESTVSECECFEINISANIIGLQCRRYIPNFYDNIMCRSFDASLFGTELFLLRDEANEKLSDGRRKNE